MELKELKCQYEGCELILENPVTLLCGNTLCREHLNEFHTKFNCYFCHKQHSVPDDGYFVNESIELKIENYYQSDSLRKEAKELFNKLNDIIYDYEKINPDSFIFDYIGEIRIRLDLHRDEMIEEVNQKSEEMIKQIKDKEQICKSNSSKIKKINLERLKQDHNYLSSKIEEFYSSGISRSKKKEQNDLLSQINKKIVEIQIETKKYKRDSLMNEVIYFEKYENSSSFGKISFFSNKSNALSQDCGQLLKSFGINLQYDSSIQADEMSNKLISASTDKTIKIWNMETGECLKTLTDHEYRVTSILIVPNNKFLSGSGDKTIIIWDLNSYECLNTLIIDFYPLCLCLISDNQIACGFENGLISILDSNSLKFVKSFKAHDDFITYLLLFDKTKFISCSGDKKIKIWNIYTFECVKILEGHSSTIYSLDLTSDGNLLSCSRDRTVKLWQIETCEMLKSIDFDHQVCIKNLNDVLIAVGLFGNILIYDLDKHQTIKTIKAYAYSYSVHHLCLLSNGNLMSSSEYGEIKYWKIFDKNLDEFEMKLDLDTSQSDQLRNDELKLKESSNKLNRLIQDYERIDPDVFIFDYIGAFKNKVYSHRNEIIEEIHIKSEDLIKNLKQREQKCYSNSAKFKRMNLDKLKSADLRAWKNLLRKPDLKQKELIDLLAKINEKLTNVQKMAKNYKNNLLMNEAIYFEKYEKSSSVGKLSFYSNKSNVLSQDCGQLLKKFNHNRQRIKSIQVDEISNKLISVSIDSAIKIWNLETGECLKTLNEHELVSVILKIPNNKFISASIDKTIKIWDLNSYECLNTLTYESVANSYILGTSGVYSLCLIPYNQIACGCADGSIIIWDLTSLTKVKTFKAHNYFIQQLLLFDKTKLISRSADTKIKIWNLRTFEKFKEIESESSINYLDLTSDGNLLSCSLEKTVKLWQIETGKILKSVKFEKAVNFVKSLNEDLILVSIRWCEIQVYNFNKMEVVRTVSSSDHQSGIHHLYLLANGDLLSGSDDGEIKLWKMLEIVN